MSDILLCEEKHKYIDEKLTAHELLISNNTEDIHALKTSSVRTETVVSNLCHQIEDLVDEMRAQREEMKEQRKVRTDTLLAISGAAILVLAGFVIWYIQKL